MWTNWRHKRGYRGRGASVKLFLSQLRVPLILLLLTYLVSILGLVVIPGRTPTGVSYSVSFLDAFYVVSYTATTIGFGELPYPFTSSQKLWMLGVMYSTVIAWLYAIGSLFSILSDPVFRKLRLYQRSVSRIRRQRKPFWIICGFGGSGIKLVQFLDESYIHCVVIDINQTRIDSARLANLSYDLNTLVGDAGTPQLLIDAGVESPFCRGVLALTDHNQVNLTISTNTKILAPQTLVYARSNDDANTRNLTSFNTEVVIDPLRMAALKVIRYIDTPKAFALHQELVDPGFNHIQVFDDVKSGHWIICASGRFAELLCESMIAADLQFILVNKKLTFELVDGQWIFGSGTEARTLYEAGIKKAAGILAVTDDDGDNLSILLTAKAEARNIIVIGRRNRATSEPVFGQASFSLVLREGEMMAQEMFARIRTPVLHQFLFHLDVVSESLVQDIFDQLRKRCHGSLNESLDHFDLTITENGTTAFPEANSSTDDLKIKDLISNRVSSQPGLPLLCLFIARSDGNQVILPNEELKLSKGDQLLLWGFSKAGGYLNRFLNSSDLVLRNH